MVRAAGGRGGKTGGRPLRRIYLDVDGDGKFSGDGNGPFWSADTVTVGGFPGVIPTVRGRAWVTGMGHYLLDPDDPWPEGYRVNDTWGVPTA